MSTELDRNEKIAESMKGNKNAAKGKLFYDQLRKVLIQDDQLKLRLIAEKLVEAAEDGEAWAVKEIIDRVDGKAIQFQEITGADGEPLVTSISVNFVKPKETND
jgi:hypothetical protein